ncbi:MAG TPA: hypothetical protein VFG09_10125 [Thermodesulfovibrionales bacterium]|nr:hypothetical protein [Thermodesulfovibrionales bacterium]
MGEVIPFVRKEKRRQTFESDFTEILKDVVEVKRKSLCSEENGIFRLAVSFEDFLKAKIGSFIIEHKLMNADLFRCGLYVSHVLTEALSRKIESCYATDYYLRGFEEDDPLIMQQGADLCCILCIFFEERRNWRMMKTGDYARMGTQLYALSYGKTKKTIAWHMSRNFDRITAITRKCVTSLETLG